MTIDRIDVQKMVHQSALRVEFSRPLTPVQAHEEVLGFIWLEIVKSDLQVPEKQLRQQLPW